MTTKTNLSGLISMVQAMEERKEDYLVHSHEMSMDDDKSVRFGNNEYPLTPYAHGQVADKLGIPRAYYERMGADAPGLRSLNVNAWLARSDQNYMVRTLERPNVMRALLSDRFKVMDNAMMLNAVVPVLHDIPNLEIHAAELSETRMYIKFILPTLTSEVKQGEIVSLGASIRNSEIGAGAYDIEVFVMVLRCLNGLVMNSLLRKTHLGRRMEQGDGDMRIYKEDTIAADIQAIQLMTRDTLANALSQAHLDQITARFRAAADDAIVDMPKAIERITKRFNLSDTMGQEIIFDMGLTGNANRWGVLNGITAMAKKQDDPDKRYNLEKLGSQVLDMSREEWRAVA